MTVATEQNNLGDLLKFETPLSREEVTVAQGEKLVLGTVVGQESEGGSIKALNPTATDGTENPVGAVIADGVIITRDAIFADHAVVWPTSITEEQKTAAIKKLKERSIVIRKGV